ncbi:MAG: dTMP kinase [Candidatus Dormibacteraeota bacterium]|nr:dTMP kinase [Candidatus Dormibacteraeota bacterium]
MAPEGRGGFFITVEGMDGSGKTTHVGRLAEALSHDGHQVQVVRDPGTTALGERLRSLLLEPSADWRLEPLAEVALFLAGRVQLAAEVVAPALATGKVVIADRFLDSSLVYQGARGVPWEAILELHRICGVEVTPDLTLILDLEAEVARARRADRLTLDRLEASPTAYHEKVRRGYLEIARHFPERVVVVSATRGADEVALECLELARARLGTRRNA